MPEPRPKLIYVARRNPALARSEFTPRWRQHGALGMSMPRWKNIARYVHCDVLPVPRATNALDGEPDGIGIVWHRSEEARAAHVADTSSRERMERDERETFDRPVVEFCAVTREVVLLPPQSTSPAFKITRLQTARDRTQGADLAQHRETASAGTRERLRKAGIEVHGHVVNEPLPRENGARWGLDVDCIEELWFADIQSAVRAAEHLAAGFALDETSGMPPAGSAQILTNEVVLHQI